MNEELGMRNESGGFAENIWGDARRSVDRRFSSYRQPSPRGEGAPKGRIGHWRYEREMRKTEQRGICGGTRESLTANDND